MSSEEVPGDVERKETEEHEVNAKTGWDSFREQQSDDEEEMVRREVGGGARGRGRKRRKSRQGMLLRKLWVVKGVKVKEEDENLKERRMKKINREER